MLNPPPALLLVLPILIPLVTGAVALLAYRSLRWQRLASLAGALALTAAALALFAQVNAQGVLAAQMGGWAAPFGITLVADIFSALMVGLASVVGLAGVIYSLASIPTGPQRYGYHPLYHFLLMGVCGAFLTGDLFNLYVWFEVMLMASFVLLALGGERGQMEGAIKYVTLNLLSSALFLATLGILYGLAGTLNMADLAVKVRGLPVSAHGLLTTLAMLFLVAFGIKAAIFPLFFWLPASYHTPPAAVAAVFAGLLTKVGVYALLRVFTLIFVHRVDLTHTLILILAGLTMVTGVLGAVAQNDFRRILSFHIVSQIGYMLMGLGLFTPLGLAASIFYVTHHILVKTNLFLISGVVHRLQHTQALKQLGGLYRSRPGLSALFLIPALSLAGLPPLSGFVAKLGLVQAGLAQQQYLIVGVSLAVSLLTLFSMTKIWGEAFWKPAPGLAPEVVDLRLWLLPIAVLAGLTVAVGLGAGPLFALAQRAGEQLMDPSAYLNAVLGGDF